MKIGFDLWGTLIEANPLFKERKKDLYEKYFKRTEGCEEVMQGIKKQFNQIIDHSGWQPDDNVMNRMIASLMNSDVDTVKAFMKDYQRLALVYSPLLITKDSSFVGIDTLGIVKDLAKNNKLYLVSNTMFLKGTTLIDVLIQLDLYDSFDILRFSDERKVSKPSPYIFNEPLDYFIGDNPLTDGFYAEEIQANFIHINSNDKTLQDAYDIITEG